MACSRCGAPLEFANGQPVACHFCGSVERPPEAAAPFDGPPRGSGSAPQSYVVVQAPDEDFEEADALQIQAPPPYVPTARGSVVGKIVLVAAIVLGAGVVLSIVASSGSGERHPSHQHRHGR
jgi:hypothetical protein